MRLFKFKKCKRIAALHYSPDVRQLVVIGGAEARTVEVAGWLDLASGETTHRIDFLVDCYAINPDHTRFVIGWSPFRRKDLPDMVRWCELSSGNAGPWQRLAGPWLSAKNRWLPYESGIGTTGLVFHDGSTLLIGYRWRPQLQVYDHAIVQYQFDPKGPGEMTATNEFPPDLPLSTLVRGPDGSLAAGGGIDNDVEVWVRRPGGVFHKQFAPPGTCTHRLRFAPNRPLLAVANGRKVYLLNLDQSEPIATLTGHTKQVNDLAFTLDGRRLLSASHDGIIQLWDVATATAAEAFNWGIGPVTAIAIAPDGMTAAAGGSNGRVVVWDLEG